MIRHSRDRLIVKFDLSCAQCWGRIVGPMGSQRLVLPDHPTSATPSLAKRRGAYTLIEFICVAAFIGILISLLLPAVQAAREAARRCRCSMQLQNLIIAVHHYEFQQSRLPSGVVNNTGPIRQAPFGYHHNWISAILPYMEEKNLHERIDFSAGVYDPPNLTVRKTVLPILLCPSTASASNTGPYSCYAGNHHHRSAPIDATNTGVFFLNSRLRQDDIFDGTSYTIYLMEKPIDELDFGWMSGTYATLRNADGMSRTANAPRRKPLPGMADFVPPFDLVLQDGAYPLDYQFNSPSNSGAPVAPMNAISTDGGSPHPGGAQFAYGDGKVGFISRSNVATMQELCHRQDGRLPQTDR
jgi:competence protein ComGC